VNLLPSLEIPAIAELAQTPAWVCWRSQIRKGKRTKVPHTPAGSPASSTDPHTWSSYAECFQAAYVRGDHDGIGRVLVGDGIAGIDLDNRRDPLPEIISYAELSPSGTGLHIWRRGSWPCDGNKRGGIEVYERRRFLTITGAHLSGTPEDIRGADLRPLQRHFAARPGSACSVPTALLRERLALPGTPGQVDVDSLARKCPQLARILAASYPSQSERDLALVRFAKLAGRPPADAWALIATVRTDGKAQRHDYAARTIALVYLEAR
jgi:putative DNA primase/helicase